MSESYKPAKQEHTAFKYGITAILIVFAWLPIRIWMQDASFEKNGIILKLIPIVVSFALSLFYLLDPVRIKGIIIAGVIHILFFMYLAVLPGGKDSQSVQNAIYFMFILLWFSVFLAYSDLKIKGDNLRGFIGLSGEVIIWSTLFVIGGAVIVGLSLALFNTIGINAEDFYQKNVITLGLVASPFVSLLVIDKLNKLKLSTIIAHIFLPLILISVVVFGIASVFSAKKPYEDRDIFIVYNILMVIVICVLVFTSINDFNNKIITVCSVVLPIVTVLLDIITISAVVYRLNKYGITANKITLLGTNILMLGHLVYIVYLRIKSTVSMNVNYLPLYAVWATCVVFVFPFIFKFV